MTDETKPNTQPSAHESPQAGHTAGHEHEAPPEQKPISGAKAIVTIVILVLVGDARRAALNAGFVRLRPVVMTALAMIIGMIPMSLGLGDGGEQNAPLGRAVIGGLLLATVATLFFVPAFFSVVHGWLESRRKTTKGAVRAGTIDEFDQLAE